MVVINATFIICLYIGMIRDLFHVSGKTPEFIQFLCISDRGSTNTESHIFNIRIEILSWPCALLTLRFLIIFRISSFSKLIEDNLDWVLKEIAEGSMLLLGKGVHWAAKKSLNRFAFSVKSDTILLFTNNEGLRVFYYHYRKI